MATVGYTKQHIAVLWNFAKVKELRSK